MEFGVCEMQLVVVGDKEGRRNGKKKTELVKGGVGAIKSGVVWVGG